MGLFSRKREPEQRPDWRGPATLEAALVPIESLAIDERNARRHPERNLDAIRLSLERFGQRKPVVIRNGVVIAGNGTLLSARALGWTRIAVADAADLTDDEARAYAVADNKTSDLAKWDYEAMAARFQELPDDLLDATGFAAFEREPIMQAIYPSAADEAPPTTEGVIFKVTHEQHQTIRRAIERMTEQAKLPPKQDGKAIVLVCREYILKEIQ